MIVTVSSNDVSLNWLATGEERIVQNVLNIIRTKQHEVPFMSGLGINHDYVDSTLSESKHDLISHVKSIIEAYEPRAKVNDVIIDSCDENGNYIISVELEV